MKLYIVMFWGSDDVPIGIFDDINKAKVYLSNIINI